MTITEVGDFLGVPVKTLYRWSSEGTGPVALRIGKHLRYRSEDLQKWLTTTEKVPTN
jgi:excisionase family DNA binding protein